MNLDSLGWNEHRHDLFAEYAREGLQPARVVRSDRGHLQIGSESGVQPATVAGRLRHDLGEEPVVVGDWVAADCCHDTWQVRAVLARTGVLARQRPGRAARVQVVAANVDRVLVVEGLDRGPNRGRIERGTTLAWDGGATPVVVLTKTDLCSDLAAALAVARAAALYCDVVAVSSRTGHGLDTLAGHLIAGTTAVLLGASGAGKTSLANRLLGDAHLATAPVRPSDSKGRHTTSHRQLVLLPGGSCLIDTPGVRELGLWLSAEAVDSAFADLAELAAGCRFRDCRHQGEPGCAVLSAVQQGLLEQERLAAWHKLRREAVVLEARTDVSVRLATKAAGRRLARLARSVQRLKDKR